MYIGRNMYTCIAQIIWLWLCGKFEVIWVKYVLCNKFLDVRVNKL